jgi:AcrR family transcriptional regulator
MLLFLAQTCENTQNMPKVVDHEARRRELAAAVWRVISARGPQAVTIREVAAEAGWSSGALRHYFANKEDLQVFAFRLAGERAAARIRAHGGEPLDRLLEHALPLDDERADEARIWFAFVGQASSNPRLQEELEAAYRWIADWVASQLPADLADRRTVAALLFAAVDGIAVQALASPQAMTPARQRAALRLHVDALLGS